MCGGVGDELDGIALTLAFVEQRQAAVQRGTALRILIAYLDQEGHDDLFGHVADVDGGGHPRHRIICKETTG
jgi:hypothetical protein